MLILNGLSTLFSLETYKKSFFSKIFRFVPRGSSSRGSSSGVHCSQAAVVRRRAQNAAKPPLKEKWIVDKQLTRGFKSFILLDAIPDLRDSMNTYKNVCFDFFAKYHPSSKRCLPIQKRAHRYHEQDNLRKG
jgi:hypothetical protein